MKTRLLAWLFALSLLGAAGTIVWQARGLPDRVATHFDTAGEPNGWTPRTADTFVSVAVMAGLSLFVVGTIYSVRFFGPETLNVPNAAHWRAPEHYPEACTILLRFGLGLGIASAWWGALLYARIAGANRLSPPRLDGSDIPTALFFAGIAVWTVLLWLRFRRVP